VDLLNLSAREGHACDASPVNSGSAYHDFLSRGLKALLLESLGGIAPTFAGELRHAWFVPGIYRDTRNTGPADPRDLLRDFSEPGGRDVGLRFAQPGKAALSVMYLVIHQRVETLPRLCIECGSTAVTR